jgi:drug/metabolite transporter (DMT)-like permease
VNAPKNITGIWSHAPLAGMVASEVAITVSIELLARRAHLSLATILVDRSLLALALLALILRPSRSQWTPRSPRLALLRVLTGGLTFVGWFGAIGLLSGRVTQAVLLLDALILAYVRGSRRPYERRTLLVLASALILFAAQAVREPGTVLNAGRGIMFLVIALGSRAATYKVWERAQGKDEHLFWLIAPALVGATLGGIFLSVATHSGVQSLSPEMWAVMLLVAIVGLTGYFYMNTVMSLLGAFYTRVVELWQVPMLWAIHSLTDHAHIDLIQGALGTLVACASAYTYLKHRLALNSELASPTLPTSPPAQSPQQTSRPS